MSHPVRASPVAIGALSVIIYGLVAAAFWGSSWHWVGVIFAVLTAFRTLVWFRQLYFRFGPDDDA